MKDSVDSIQIDFGGLLEANPHRFVALAADGKIMGASDAFVDATGIKRQKLVGKTLREAFPFYEDSFAVTGSETGLEESLQFVVTSLEPHTLDPVRILLPRAHGKYDEHFWRIHNIPVLFEKSQLLCIIHKIEDVTDLEVMRREAEQNQVRNTELEAAEHRHLARIHQVETRFTKLFNVSPIPIFLMRADNRCLVLVNQAFEQLLGRDAKSLTGHSLPDLGILSSQAMEALHDQIVSGNSRISDLEVALSGPGGANLQMLASAELVELDDSAGYIVAMMDITARKSLEQELVQSNHFLDTILENLPDMVYVKDAETLSFIHLNKAGQQILGKSQAEVKGKTNSDLYTGEIAAAMDEAEAAVLLGNQSSEPDERSLNTSIGQRWMLTKRIPVHENGKPRYIVAIAEDITDRRKQQEAILQLNKELEAFSYSVSHDLRAPLRAVTGYAQILDEDYGHVLDAEGKRLLNTISSNAEKMGHLIDNLLTFSRLGRKDMQKREVNMTDVFERAINEINRTTPNKARIELNNILSAPADADLMMHVIINLLENAIKYSSRKEQPTVEISSYRDGNEIVYCIADNGAGFDMRYYDKLFGVFQRLHALDEFEGSGVGLAIVQRIIGRHGGRVWAKSKLNEGATFCFSLPV